MFRNKKLILAEHICKKIKELTPTNKALFESIVKDYNSLALLINNDDIMPSVPSFDEDDLGFYRGCFCYTSKGNEKKELMLSKCELYIASSSRYDFIKGCIILVFAFLIIGIPSFLNSAKQIKKDYILASAESILTEAEQISCDSPYVLGYINAVIKNYNDFCTNIEHPCDTLEVLSKRINEGFYGKIDSEGRERLLFIKIKMMSYVKGHKKEMTEGISFIKSGWFDLICKILGIILSFLAVYYARKQTLNITTNKRDS